MRKDASFKWETRFPYFVFNDFVINDTIIAFVYH